MRNDVLKPTEQNNVKSTTKGELERTLMGPQMDARIMLAKGKFEPKFTTILDDNGEHVLECALVPVYVGDDEQFCNEEFPFHVEIVEPVECETFTSGDLDDIALRTMQANDDLKAWENEHVWDTGVGDIDGDCVWIAGQTS